MNTAYRVWDGKKMHYGHEEGLRLTIENDGSWSLRVVGAYGCVISSDDEEAALMWGTGLKDKNGKMIYEYDIDMIDGEPMIVTYIDGHIGLKLPDDINYFDDCIAWEDCDIGGNVYENPELLEGAKCQK